MLEYVLEMAIAARLTNWMPVEMLATHLIRTRTEGRTLYVCGNGGSHSVAEHWGVDLVKQGHLDTYTLGTNSALSTALANDLDYEVALSTELLARAEPGDVLVALSCSGTSKNILEALNAAKALNLHAYLITGRRAPEASFGYTIRMIADDYGVLEDLFAAIGHSLTRRLAQ